MGLSFQHDLPIAIVNTTIVPFVGALSFLHAIGSSRPPFDYYQNLEDYAEATEIAVEAYRLAFSGAPGAPKIYTTLTDEDASICRHVSLIADKNEDHGVSSPPLKSSDTGSSENGKAKTGYKECAHCGLEEGEKLKQCPCKKAFYCSPEHQRLHWKATHRLSCSARKSDSAGS